MLLGNLVSPAGRSTTTVFDRSTLDLEGFWPAVYTNTSWPGQASGGASSGRNLTEATNYPTRVADILGAGGDVADFDGNDLLTGAAVSTFHTTTALSGWALVYVTAISTNNTANYALNDLIVGTNGTAEYFVYLRNNGAGTDKVGFQTAAVSVGAEADIALNDWQLVQWKRTGGNNLIRVNRGSWSSQAASDPSSLAAALKVGTLTGAEFFVGRMGEIALSKPVFSDTEFDDVCDSIEADYGITLA